MYANPSLPTSTEKSTTVFFLMRAKMVTVWYADRSKGAHLLGSSEPEVLARLLLTDLVREELDKS
jgi:hypothetical protein